MMANVTGLRSVMGLIRRAFRLQGAWLDDGGHGLTRQRAKSCACVLTEYSS